tara:strand:+ start:2072 stop:3847 length:1776 start_codon:yes stop_codon:yes gene_type:complete
METSQLMISNYIDTFENINFLRGKLLEKGIYSKVYSEEGLLLIYTKYEPIVKSISNLVKNDNKQELVVSELNNLSDHELNKLKLECRSLIIDINEKKIVSYSCNTPICNLDAINYLLNSKNKTKYFEEDGLKPKLKIEKFKCYEGTLLSLFCNKDKWYLSTRRNLNCQDSVWNNISYNDLFLDIINESGVSSFDEFVSNLDMSYCYYFILIHFKNKNIVDYTSRFGDNYKRLCLAFVREKNSLSEIDVDTIVRNELESNEKIKTSLNYILGLKNIFLPEKVENDLTSIGNKNGNTSPTSFELKSNTFNDSMTSCDDEGIIIKIKNDNNISYFLKIQTYSYQFNKAIGAEKNIFKGFLNLYQNNQLVNYLQSNENLSNFRKIINPINMNESYDTIGIIDSVFKVCTSELYELFKILWDIKTGKQSDTEIYKILPKEYKSILYYIRGIYFKKKFSFDGDDLDNNSKQSNDSLCELNELSKRKNDNNKIFVKKKEIQIKDIYQYLKKGLDTDKLEQFLRVRKLMYNWIKVDSENESLKKFSKVNVKCDKVHLKLIAIFSNKLFPNIMPDDIPDPTNLSKSFGSLNSFGSLSSLN